MRRKDRELVDPDKVEQIIAGTQIMRVGFYDEGEIYIVPVNFGYVKNREHYTFYFHGAKAGRKYELSKSASKVGFELDRNYALIEGDSACSFSAEYQEKVLDMVAVFRVDVEKMSCKAH